MKSNRKKIEESSEFDRILDFDINISRSQIPRIIPFVIFLTLLVLIYIGNKFYSERSMIEQTKLKNELKDLRAQSLTSKSELMKKTKMSEVARLVEPLGMKQLSSPPKKISKEEK